MLALRAPTVLGVSCVPSFYSTQTPDDSVDDVIIGSGMGGMVLAGILSRQGRRVCVLEQHYVPGGVTHSFRRPGHRWNVGVHVIGDVHPTSLNGMILNDLCERPIVWDSLGEHYDRVEFVDESFEIPSSEEAFQSALENRFPDEREGIRKYFEMIRRATFVSILHFVYKCLPWHGKWAMWPWLRRPSKEFTLRTTQQTVETATSDPKLRRLLMAQWGYYGTPPSESSFVAHAQVTAHFFKGGYYPRGGGSLFAENLLGPVVKRGGSVAIRAQVKQILFRGKRATGVELASGKVIEAKRVFSNAGAYATAALMGVHPSFAPWAEEVKKLPSSSGHVSLFLGLDQGSEELGLGARNLWVYGDEIEKVQNVSDVPYPTEKFSPMGYWFSFGSAKDHAHDHEKFGHSAQAITFVPSDWFEPFFDKKRGKRGADYERLKETIQQGLLDAILKRFPQLEGHIQHVELSTPASTHTFTGRPKGSVYGLAASPARFWSLKFGTRTPSPNVFLTGADAAMVGVMGALAGGLLAAYTASPWSTIRYLFRLFRRTSRTSKKPVLGPAPTTPESSSP